GPFSFCFSFCATKTPNGPTLESASEFAIAARKVIGASLALCQRTVRRSECESESFCSLCFAARDVLPAADGRPKQSCQFAVGVLSEGPLGRQFSRIPKNC